MILKNDYIKQILSKQVKYYRQKAKLSQDALAEKLEKSTGFVKDIEKGKYAGSIETLVNLCLVLNITPNQLFSDIFSNEKELEFNQKFSMLNLRDKDAILTLLDYYNNAN